MCVVLSGSRAEYHYPYVYGTVPDLERGGGGGATAGAVHRLRPRLDRLKKSFSELPERWYVVRIRKQYENR
jgi:hypothetical protein